MAGEGLNRQPWRHQRPTRNAASQSAEKLCIYRSTVFVPVAFHPEGGPRCIPPMANSTRTQLAGTMSRVIRTKL